MSASANWRPHAREAVIRSMPRAAVLFRDEILGARTQGKPGDGLPVLVTTEIARQSALPLGSDKNVPFAQQDCRRPSGRVPNSHDRLAAGAVGLRNGCDSFARRQTAAHLTDVAVRDALGSAERLSFGSGTRKA